MDSYSVFGDRHFSMETEILEVDLRKFTPTDFYNKKVLISAIFLSRNGGRKINEWLKENPKLVLKQDQKNSKDSWGKNSSFFQNTAFFNLESESSDGYDGRRIITPAYELSDLLTTEQISQTPTMIELYFGILKKYPEYMERVYSCYKGDVDIDTYLKWMNPKSLIKNNI